MEWNYISDSDNNTSMEVDIGYIPLLQVKQLEPSSPVILSDDGGARIDRRFVDFHQEQLFTFLRFECFFIISFCNVLTGYLLSVNGKCNCIMINFEFNLPMHPLRQAEKKISKIEKGLSPNKGHCDF